VDFARQKLRLTRHPGGVAGGPPAGKFDLFPPRAAPLAIVLVTHPTDSLT